MEDATIIPTNVERLAKHTKSLIIETCENNMVWHCASTTCDKPLALVYHDGCWFLKRSFILSWTLHYHLTLKRRVSMVSKKKKGISKWDQPFNLEFIDFSCKQRFDQILRRNDMLLYIIKGTADPGFVFFFCFFNLFLFCFVF